MEWEVWYVCRGMVRCPMVETFNSETEAIEFSNRLVRSGKYYVITIRPKKQVSISK